VTAAAYSPEVLRRCREMTRAGGWPPEDPLVATGTAGRIEDGAMASVQLRLDAAGLRVLDTRFKVFGCSAAVASTSLVADRLVGASRAEARAIDARAVAEALDLPEDKRQVAGVAVAAAADAVDAWARQCRDRGPGTREDHD
jgi:nitrogen fixation NifU-like protein